MSEEALPHQAEQLETLLRALMRRLFPLELDFIGTELSLPQRRLLFLLQAGPLTSTALSHELGISLAAITQSADLLERDGLVERVSSREDRRVRYLQLTTHGAQIMAARKEARVQRVRHALHLLSLQQREAVLQAVQSLEAVCVPSGSALLLDTSSQESELT